MTNVKLTPLGYSQIAVSSGGVCSSLFTGLTASSTPTLAAVQNADVVKLQAESGTIRWRDDGQAPTASGGMILSAGQEPYEFWGGVRKVQATGIAGAVVLDASFYKIAG